MCQWNGAGDGNATLVFFLENNIGGLLVDSDTKAFQFPFNNSLVGQRLIHVKHYENEMARLGNGNNLPSASLTILGTFDDTRKVKYLKLGTIVHHLSRNGRQGGEFIRGSYSKS